MSEKEKQFCSTDSWDFDGDDEEVEFGEMTPLQSAALSGNLDAVKAVLDSDLSYINHNNYRRFNALGIAAARGHWEVVKYLVLRGAIIDNFTTIKTHQSALWYAVSSVAPNVDDPPPHFDIITFLLQNGADINNTYDESGVGVLMLALRYKNIKLLQFLLDQGANPNFSSQFDSYGDTPLSFILMLGGEGALSLAKILVDHGGLLPPTADTRIDGPRSISRILSSDDPAIYHTISFALSLCPTTKTQQNINEPYFNTTNLIFGCIKLMMMSPSHQQEQDLFATATLILKYAERFESCDVVNTPVVLNAAEFGYDYGLNNSIVAQIFAPLVGTRPSRKDKKQFTLYDLATITNKQHWVDYLSAYASYDTIQHALKYTNLLLLTKTDNNNNDDDNNDDDNNNASVSITNTIPQQ